MILFYGLILFCTPLMAVFSIVGLIFDTRSWRKYLCFLIIFIFTVSYSYQPIGDPDLYRYFQYINECKGLSLFEVKELFNDSLFVKNFFFWLVANMNNPHLIPAITTSLVYGVGWYITCDSAENWNQLKNIPIIMTIQAMCWQFISIVNNVRNVSAFALVTLAVYLDIVKRKKNLGILLLYVLPIFIHPAAILIIILRLLLLLPKGYILISTILAVLFSTLVNLLYVSGLANYFGAFFSKNLDKLWWYLNDPLTSEWSQSVSNSLVFSIQRWTMMAMALVLILTFYFSNVKKLKNNNISRFMSFDVLLNIITLGCIPIITPQYWRFSTVALIAAGPTLMRLWKMHNTISVIMKSLIIVLSILLVCIQVLQSRYNVDLGDLISKTLINNIYIIFGKFILGILGIRV